MAFMASTTPKTNGIGWLEMWVTVGSPRNSTIRLAEGAVPTMPSMSACPSPASRMALTLASSAMSLRERALASRKKPVEPTPTMAIWSLMGLRAMSRSSGLGRLEGRVGGVVAVDPGELHRHADPHVFLGAVDDR